MVMARWMALAGGLVLVGILVLVVVSVVGRKLFAVPVPGDVELTSVTAAVASAWFFPWCFAVSGDVKVDFFTKQFTDALRECVDMGNFKYAVYTDKVYVSIFREKSKDYRRVLQLSEKDRVRDTFYSEILDLIASYECGLADALVKESTAKGRKLSPLEVDAIFKSFEGQAHWKPLVERARVKMASRDLAFRDALHLQLQQYVSPLAPDEFERFIGDRSKDLAARLEEASDVMRRLKERDA